MGQYASTGHKEKTWRLRYFILQPGETPSLIYYRNPQAGEPPANSLPLKGARVTVRQLGVSAHCSPAAFLFSSTSDQMRSCCMQVKGKVGSLARFDVAAANGFT